MKKVFSTLVRLYQLTLSPLFISFGGGCRFYPSCSVYSRDAFKKHGLPKAVVLSVWRVLRCNPFSPGGLDPVK